MSIAALNWARTRRGIPASEKALLMVLADQARDVAGGWACWWREKKLAPDVGVSVRQLQRLISGLIRRGLIAVEARFDALTGRRKSNRYWLADHRGRFTNRTPKPSTSAPPDMPPGTTPSEQPPAGRVVRRRVGHQATSAAHGHTPAPSRGNVAKAQVGATRRVWRILRSRPRPGQTGERASSAHTTPVTGHDPSDTSPTPPSATGRPAADTAPSGKAEELVRRLPYSRQPNRQERAALTAGLAAALAQGWTPDTLVPQLTAGTATARDRVRVYLHRLDHLEPPLPGGGSEPVRYCPTHPRSHAGTDGLCNTCRSDATIAAPNQSATSGIGAARDLLSSLRQTLRQGTQRASAPARPTSRPRPDTATDAAELAEEAARQQAALRAWLAQHPEGAS